MGAEIGAGKMITETTKNSLSVQQQAGRGENPHKEKARMVSDAPQNVKAKGEKMLKSARTDSFSDVSDVVGICSEDIIILTGNKLWEAFTRVKNVTSLS